MTDSRVSHEGLEVLQISDVESRVSQLGLEVLMIEGTGPTFWWGISLA